MGKVHNFSVLIAMMFVIATVHSMTDVAHAIMIVEYDGRVSQPIWTRVNPAEDWNALPTDVWKIGCFAFFFHPYQPSFGFGCVGEPAKVIIRLERAADPTLVKWYTVWYVQGGEEEYTIRWWYEWWDWNLGFITRTENIYKVMYFKNDGGIYRFSFELCEASPSKWNGMVIWKLPVYIYTRPFKIPINQNQEPYFVD